MSALRREVIRGPGEGDESGDVAPDFNLVSFAGFLAAVIAEAGEEASVGFAELGGWFETFVVGVLVVLGIGDGMAAAVSGVIMGHGVFHVPRWFSNAIAERPVVGSRAGARLWSGFVGW